MKLKTEIAGEKFTFEKPEDLAVAISSRLKEVTEELNQKQKVLEKEFKERKKNVDILKKKATILKKHLKQFGQ